MSTAIGQPTPESALPDLTTTTGRDRQRASSSSPDVSGTGLLPLLLRPEEAAALLGIGRSKLFELLASGAIQSVQIGSSRRVPVAALEEFVRDLRGSITNDVPEEMS